MAASARVPVLYDRRRRCTAIPIAVRRGCRERVEASTDAFDTKRIAGGSSRLYQRTTGGQQRGQLRVQPQRRGPRGFSRSSSRTLSWDVRKGRDSTPPLSASLCSCRRFLTRTLPNPARSDCNLLSALHAKPCGAVLSDARARSYATINSSTDLSYARPLAPLPVRKASACVCTTLVTLRC